MIYIYIYIYIYSLKYSRVTSYFHYFIAWVLGYLFMKDFTLETGAY